MLKKGQGMQFNWIFIMVVSAIILLFFAGFLVKYLDLQEDKQDMQIARKFSNSILSIKSTEQYKEFSVSSNFRADYDCEDVIINLNQRFQIPYTIVMDNFDANNLILWVEEYKKDFLVDRVVFITDSDKKYYFDEEYLFNLPPLIETVSNPKLADVVVSSTHYEDGKKNVNPTGMEDFFVYVEAFSNAEISSCVKEKLDSKYENLLKIYRGKAEKLSFNSNCKYVGIVNAVDSKNSQEISNQNRVLSSLDCEVVY